MRKRLKGISPIIAVIMLIAFTLMVAGILAGWATQFVSTQRQQLQMCSKAQIFIQRATYSNGKLSLLLYNSGQVELNGFTINIIFENTTAQSFNFNQTIDRQNFKTFEANIPNNIDEVRVISKECDGVQDFLSKYDIQGI